jgi:hypothetical protein
VAVDYAPKSVLIRATLSEGAGPGVVEGRVLGVDLTVKAQGRGEVEERAQRLALGSGAAEEEAEMYGRAAKPYQLAKR